MRRIVIDTSVVVAGLRPDWVREEKLFCGWAPRADWSLGDPPLFLEYEDVLKRPEHRLAHGLATRRLKKFLAE